MKKGLGLVQAVYPMPVLMVAAYDENGKVNVMNVGIATGNKMSDKFERTGYMGERVGKA